MKIDKRILGSSTMYTICALIGLKISGLVMNKEVSVVAYSLTAVGFFIFMVIRQYYMGGFIPSLNEKVQTKEESLKDIYSKRSNDELEAIISNENAADEAKSMAKEIRKERKNDL